MGRHIRVLSAAAIAAAIGAGAPAVALGQQLVRRAPVLQSVRATIIPTAAISGTVSDEHGGPLPGAMVSVIGATIAMDVTDAQGRFSLGQLPIGEYILAAHRQGFAAARRQIVRVGSGPLPSYRLQLHRLDAAVATSGTAGGTTVDTTLASRPILSAGFDLPQIDLPDGKADKDGHPHTETAWLLRHLPRSVLKDSSNVAVVPDDEPPSGSLFGRAMDSAASVAASIFTDIPFTGEVNLLTTSAFAPGELFAGDIVPRGVAYVSIGSPTSAGDWQVRAAMGEGDLSSWIVAGSFVSRRGSFHSYDLGLSYSTQEYSGGTPMSLASVTDGSRNVGELYGVDRWTLSPAVSFEYGGRYAHYDYLSDRGLVSPRAGFVVEPVKGTKVTTMLAQRMVAPGAEEFLSPGPMGPWLPPERTFAPLRGEEFRVERARSIDVLFEHEFEGSWVLGVRRFFQSVDDQLVTVFGMQMPEVPRSTGHYVVGSAGDVETEGWGVRIVDASDPARAGRRRLQPRACPVGRARRDVAHRRLGAGGDPPDERGHPRPHRAGAHEHPRNLDARLRPLQGEQRIHASRPDAAAGRPRRTVRFPGEPGAAVRRRGHAVGSAPRHSQPVPRSRRSGVALRRAPRRPASQARRRGVPRSILRSRWSRFGWRRSGLSRGPIFLSRPARSRYLKTRSTSLEDRRQRNHVQQRKSLFLSDLWGGGVAVAGMAFAIPEVDKFIPVRGSAW